MPRPALPVQLSPDQKILLVAFAAAGLALVLVPPFALAPFARVLGALPPLLALAACLPLGVLALVTLDRCGWPVSSGSAGSPLWIAALLLLGALCSLPMVLLDIARPFPAGINVPLIHALLFYPVIALLAEILFHLVPLALLLTAVRCSGHVRLPVLLTAAVEPAYQVIFTPGSPVSDALMALILLGFGLVQLEMFRRRGLAALLAMRLGYYLVWHILWGTLRLDLLTGRFA